MLIIYKKLYKYENVLIIIYIIQIIVNSYFRIILNKLVIFFLFAYFCIAFLQNNIIDNSIRFKKEYFRYKFLNIDIDWLLVYNEYIYFNHI